MRPSGSVGLLEAADGPHRLLRLAPRLLGGRMALNGAAATAAIEAKVARPLGLGVTEAAAGVVRIVNSKMAYAIRAITVQRGLDPTEFALLAFGGAGPMHACDIAVELALPTVVVPVAPGAFSAFGMLVSDVRHDMVRTRLHQMEGADPEVLAALFAELEAEAGELLARELPAGNAVIFERFLDMRYVGQEYTVKVPVAAGPLTAEMLGRLRREFDHLHDQAYGHASAAEPTEIINTRLTALGTLRPPDLPPIEEGRSDPAPEAHLGTTETCFDPTDGYLPTQLYDRDRLLADNRLTGPALILEHGATTVLNPRFAALVDRYGNLIITQEA